MARLNARRGAAAVVLAAIVAAAACGQYTLVEVKAPAERYGKIEVMSEEQVMWVPMSPLELPLDLYEIRKNGATGWLCLFPTGKAGDVYYVDAKYGTKHDRYKVTLTGEYTPDPNDGGERELTGLAKQVYELAIKVNDPENTGKVADVICRILSYDHIDTADELHTSLKGGMPALPRSWQPLGNLIAQALDKYGQTYNGAEKTLEAVYAGLRKAT